MISHLFRIVVLFAIVLTGCADRLLVGDRLLKKVPKCQFESVKLGEYATAWYVPSRDSKGTAILLPGYRTNKGYLIDYIDLWQSFNFNVLLVDYRGFGDASGNSDFKGLTEDISLAVAFAKTKHPVVVLHGFSMGTMVEAKVASEISVDGCVFDGLASPNALGWIGWFLPSEMRTRLYVPRIKQPKLFIHSVEDDVTFFNEAKLIFDWAVGPKIMWQTSGPHVLSYKYDPEGYSAAIADFLEMLPANK